ncbi:MAG TPA: glycolate oxidase subunit GlcE [Casimicrobiaceae bacterium]|jgi:glycolate oxidase FAD binding subunit
MSTVACWRERVLSAASAHSPLRIVGAGTKDFYGQVIAGEAFDTREHRGIVDYDPTELVVTARCGTPLSEIESALAAEQQMLAFEPPHFGDGATLGGCIAAGLSGPRRPYAGAVRDVVLGVRLLDGKGDELGFGGRVMKNVAGFDVSRVLAGSLGTLGIILDASLKCLPQPRSERTVCLDVALDQALARFAEWSPLPLVVSGTCWHRDRMSVRLSGATSAIAAAERRIGGDVLPDAEAFWSSVREQRHAFFAEGDGALWRASVRATAPQPLVAAPTLIEWSGALRWFRVDSIAQGHAIREWATVHGGHATLFRGEDKSAGVFTALPGALMTVHRRLKAAFDPAGILNPGRMYAEW